MANNPFKFFRKHQKAMLAVTGILAMIAFVFLDPLMGYLGGGGTPQNPAVVSTQYGTLREADLQRMVQMRSILNQFLMRAYELAYTAGGRPTAFPLMRQDARGAVGEELVVRQMLMARRAEELGFHVSDQAINQYLQQLTGGVVSSDQLRQVVQGAHVGNRPVTMDTIFEALREEMLASELEKTYEVSTAVTPAQSWEFFTRLNDRLVAEVMPVPVEDFIGEVPDPSEAELQAFYNEYKDRYLLPDLASGVELQSATPGFRQPPRARFTYVKADYDEIVDRSAAEISAEEVAEYYEANKRQFVRPQLLGEEPGGEPADQPDSQTAADESGALGPGPPEPAASEPEAPEPTVEQPSDASDQDAVPDPADEAPADDETEPPVDAPQSSLFLGKTQFVALQADEETAPEKAEGGGRKAESLQADDEALPELPAVPAVPEHAPETPAAPASKQPASEQPSPLRPSPPSYYPLDEVASDIRRELARQQAAEQVQEALAPLNAEMGVYSRQYIGWQLNQGEQPTSDPPPAPNLQQQAREAGLEYDETEMISYFDLREMPLGQATVASVGQPLATFAFAGQLGAYRPTLAIGADGSGYLVWKTAEREEYVPELAEIRDEVVQAWKRVEARELALERAKQLAAEAEEKNQPLTEVFPDRQVTQTDPFSWLTLGAVPQQMGRQQPEPRLGQIEGVEDAGPAFMEQVFALDEGEVGAAMNHPQTVAYVVRPLRHAASLDALHEQFLAQPGPWQQMAQMQNRQQVLLALNRSLSEDAELDWLRPPDTFAEEP